MHACLRNESFLSKNIMKFEMDISDSSKVCRMESKCTVAEEAMYDMRTDIHNLLFATYHPQMAGFRSFSIILGDSYDMCLWRSFVCKCFMPAVVEIVGWVEVRK